MRANEFLTEIGQRSVNKKNKEYRKRARRAAEVFATGWLNQVRNKITDDKVFGRQTNDFSNLLTTMLRKALRLDPTQSGINSFVTRLATTTQKYGDKLDNKKIWKQARKEILPDLEEIMFTALGKDRNDVTQWDAEDLSADAAQALANQLFEGLNKKLNEARKANVSGRQITSVLEKSIFNQFGGNINNFQEELKYLNKLSHQLDKEEFTRKAQEVIYNILQKLTQKIPDEKKLSQAAQRSENEIKKMGKNFAQARDTKLLNVEAVFLKKNHIIAQQIDIPRDANSAIKVKRDWHYAFYDPQTKLFKVGSKINPAETQQLGLETSKNLRHGRVEQDLDYPNVLQVLD